MVRNRHKRSGDHAVWDHDAARDEGPACPVIGFRGTPGICGLGGLTGGGLRLWRLANSGLCGTGRGYGRDRRFWSTGRPAGHHGRGARRPGLGLLGLNHSLLLGAVADGHGTHRCGCGCRCWTRTRPRPGNGPSSSGSRPSRSPAGSGSPSPASAKWLRGAPPTWRSPATTTARLAAHRHRLNPVRRHVCRGVGGPPVAVVQAHRVAGGMLQRGLRRTLEDLRQHAKRIIWIIC
jgi:hypothetical protein